MRATQTGTAPDGSRRITHRRVQSRRAGDTVRQKTLRNPGRNFAVPREMWPSVCRRIDEVLQGAGFDFGPVADAAVESEARRMAAQRVRKQGGSPAAGEGVWAEVDLASAGDRDRVSVGIESAALAALERLDLPALLRQLGFNRRQLCCAMGQQCRADGEAGFGADDPPWPGRSRAVGALLGFDVNTVRDRALTCASDQRQAHRKTIAAPLFGAADTLFDLQTTPTVCDLTKTCFEGDARWPPQAQRGHSKENRRDAPLLIRGRVRDGSGFLCRSDVCAGNVSAESPWAERWEALGTPAGGLVIRDRGVATAAPLAGRRISTS